MMDVVMNLLELMENFGVESAVAMVLFIAAFTMIFAVYKERVLKYILHERNVWGFAFHWYMLVRIFCYLDLE